MPKHHLDIWLALKERHYASRSKKDRDSFVEVATIFSNFTDADKQVIDDDRVLSLDRLLELATAAGIKLGTLKHRLIDFHRWRAQTRSTLPPKLMPITDPDLEGSFLIKPRSDSSKAEADRLSIRFLSGDDSANL